MIDEILQRIREFKVYSYESEARVRFADGTRDTMYSMLHMDISEKRLFYKNDYEMYLLTPQWAFQLNHKDQTAGVFDVKAYNKKYKKLPSLDRYFSGNVSQMLLDSLMLRAASVKNIKSEDEKVFLTLSFPLDNYIRAIHILYDTKLKMPITVHIKAFYPDKSYPVKNEDNIGGVVYEIICRNYSENVRETLFDTKSYFIVNKGKVELKMYTHYKLVSVL